ncbi:hypothetical protein [Nocardioides sp. GXZ039]|uniref:hypothetical protein n=1 Tax=Nocardioides sp. GXZ039 TaxID=3136018 RepID=UPI0030F4A041
MKVLYDDEIPVHYGFIDLNGDDRDLIDARRGQSNGLLGARFPGRLSMITGLHTGEVPLRIEWHQAEPEMDPSCADVVEASVEFAATAAVLSSFDEVIELELPQAGWHRARYSAHDMQAGSDLDATDEGESAPDRYVLQLWPAPEAPDAVVVGASEIAAYWHGVAAGHER